MIIIIIIFMIIIIILSLTYYSQNWLISLVDGFASQQPTWQNWEEKKNLTLKSQWLEIF
jgi:hypothetical protein